MRHPLAFVILLAPSLAYADEPLPPELPTTPTAPTPTPSAPTPPMTPREQCLAQRSQLAAQAQANADINERARLLRSLPECPVDPVAMATTPAVVEPEVPDNIATGFVMEGRIDSSYVVVNTTFAPGAGPGLFLGFRGPAFSAGVGLELVRVAQSMEGGGSETHASETGFMLLPGVRIRFARTREGDTELLGVLDAGIGTQWVSDDDSSDDPASPVRLRFQFGLSPRHWFTRSFALGATIGLRYELGLVSTEFNGMTIDSSASALSMFTSLHAVAVF